MEADKEQYFGELEVEYKIYLFTRPHCAVEHLRAEVLSYAAHKYNTRNRYQRQQISTSVSSSFSAIIYKHRDSSRDHAEREAKSAGRDQEAVD